MVLTPMARGLMRKAVHSNLSARLSSGLAFVCSSGLRMQPPRGPIDDQVNGNPKSDNEIPVGSILLRVHEALALNERGKEQDREHDSVDQVCNQVQDVQAHKRPHRAAVGVDAPVSIEMKQF